MIILFLFFQLSHSFTLMDAPGIPFEFKTLTTNLDKEDLEAVDPYLWSKLNSAFLTIPQNGHRLFIIKSEIYKTILEFYAGKKLAFTYLTKENFNRVKERSDAFLNDFDPFESWVYFSLMKDYENFIQAPGTLKGLGQYEVILGPWVKMFLNSNKAEMNSEMTRLKRNILQNLQKFSLLAAQELREQKNKTKFLQFKKDSTSPVQGPPQIQDPPQIADPTLKMWKPKVGNKELQAKLKKNPNLYNSKNYPVPIHTPDPQFTPFAPPVPVNDWRFTR